MAEKNNPHKGHRARMIDRLLENGTGSMSQHEMLEIILYKCYESKNTNEIAHNLLDRFENSIYKVCNASEEELTAVPGVGIATAKYLRLFPYFHDVYCRSRFEKNHCYNKIKDIGEYCVSLFAKNNVEAFYVICFDVNNGLIKPLRLAEGSAGSVNIDPRQVLGAVLNTAAVKVAFCHNHPGGSTDFSNEDRALTRYLVDLFRSVDIEVVCHVLVANGKFTTFHC